MHYMKINAKKKKAIEILLEHPEIKLSELAPMIPIGYPTLSKWVNHDEVFMKEWDEATKRAWDTAAKKAQVRLSQLIDSTNDNVALGACKIYVDKILPDKIQADVNAQVIFVGESEIED